MMASSPTENSFTEFLMHFLIFASIFLFIVSIRRKDISQGKYSFPSGPFKFPLIGNLIGLRNGEEYLTSLVPKYGDVFTIYMGSIPVVVVNSTKTAMELLSEGHLFSERAPTPVLNNYFKGRGLAGAHHPHGFWKDQRKFVTSILRTLSGSGYKTFETKLQEEIKYLKNIIKQKADGRPFDILPSLQMTSANFVWSMALGKRFNHTEALHKKLVNLIFESLRCMKYVTGSLVFPIMLKIPGNGVSKFFSYLDEVHELLAQQITSCRECLVKNKEPEHLVEFFLKEIEKYDDPSARPAFLNEDNLKVVLQDLFFAGIDTTSTTIYWLFLHLARNPTMQRKAFAAIQSVTGDKDIVELEDFGKLPYVNALIMETLRASALVPIIARSNIHDFEFRGHHIPANTWFLFNTHNMMMDESTWCSPNSFVPERFLDEGGNFVVNQNFKPFGFGRRNCQGEVLAKKEMFLLVSNLIKSFEFQLEDENNPSPLEPQTGLIRSPQPYRLRIRDRCASHTDAAADLKSLVIGKNYDCFQKFESAQLNI